MEQLAIRIILTSAVSIVPLGLALMAIGLLCVAYGLALRRDLP